MPPTQAQASAPPRPAWKIVVRLLVVLAFALTMGLVLNRSAAGVNGGEHPAGFARGLLHGALMPLALPGLLAGKDVAIYAANNAGRTYKLGYTTGVNACGAVFFGIFYWRVSRWRQRRG